MGGACRNVSDWLRLLDAAHPGLTRVLTSIYPRDTGRAAMLKERLGRSLRLYVREFGDTPVVIARAPGRLNLMGRHVDHQGGRCNMVALDRDVLIVAGRRADGWIIAANTHGADYPGYRFHRSQLPGPDEGSHWRAYLDGMAPPAHQAPQRSDWSIYCKAPLARLSALGLIPQAYGMSIVVDGEVPTAAGLSSSSAIVVGVMEAACALLGIRLQARQFVELCGEAEWFVGTRGGAGDHAAIKMAAPGHVAQMDFHPFQMSGLAPFPDGYGILICNTRMQARKMANARDQFNHRVACYHLGRAWLIRTHPWLADRVQCLRDLCPSYSGQTAVEVLRLVASLPVEVGRDELRAYLGGDVVDAWLSTHGDAFNRYPLRGVVLYGLAECERSYRTGELLRAKQMERLGHWMHISHDGDRVVQWNGHDPQPFSMDVSDAAMNRLIAAADAMGSGFDLAELPGWYRCSTPDLDAAVDLARGVEGTLGAQLCGAGLGGCIMVLARRESLDAVAERMAEQWYAPRGIEPDVFHCNPSAGSGIIELST